MHRNMKENTRLLSPMRQQARCAQYRWGTYISSGTG
jgi:hypothetical protein